MTLSREEARRQLREKYRTSYASLKPGASIEIASDDALRTGGVVIADNRDATAVQSDANEFRKQSKALAEIEELVQKYREYKAVSQEIASTEEMIREPR